jgi:hypothetical protein
VTFRWTSSRRAWLTKTRGVAQARPRRLGDRRPRHPAAVRRPAGAPPRGVVLARLPPRPRRGGPRVRLLHRRDGPAADSARALLHRDPDPAGVRRRLHRAPERNLGDAAGAAALLASRRGGQTTDGARPGPRRQVPRAFDDVFHSEGVRVVRAPFRAPRARAHAERWVGTARWECLDWLLVVGERHLDRVLREYAEHYNAARPHRALQLRSPVSRGQPVSAVGEIVRRDRLAGLVHEYERLAA